MNTILKKILMVVFAVVFIIVISSHAYADEPEDGCVYINVTLRDPSFYFDTNVEEGSDAWWAQWETMELLQYTTFDIQVNDGSVFTVENDGFYSFDRSETITWPVGTVITVKKVVIPEGYTTAEV